VLRKELFDCPWSCVLVLVLELLFSFIVCVRELRLSPQQLASGQVLRRSQGTLLPLSVNPRYRIRGTMCNSISNLISGKHFDLENRFCI
jgi:hypothetical protein